MGMGLGRAERPRVSTSELAARLDGSTGADRSRTPRDAATRPRSQDPHPATLSVHVASGLIEAAEKAGVSRVELLRAAKLEPEQLAAQDSRLPSADVYRLCEVAIDLTGDPAFGLHWSERIGEATFVLISPLIAHCSNLRQAIEALSQFHSLLNDQSSFQFIELEDKVRVRSRGLVDSSAPVQRLAAEMMVAGFVRLIRYFRSDARPDRVSFEYAAPSYHEEYARIFEHAHHFDQPFTGIEFDRALLDAPAPHKDAEVHDALQALAERRLLRITQRTPYALRVRDLLVQQVQAQRADMKTVARSLGLSVRSLRRRLVAEGKPYNTVVNEAMAIVAKHLLRDKQRTIQETAYEMGFSDANTFHRAFKSWTGTTPSVYRNAQR
jgi:AraC-like DNA-binding protein